MTAPGTPPTLSLTVQYATPAPSLPRWRLRRWVQRAIAAARADGCPPLTRLQLTLRLVDDDEGRSLNRDFRGRDSATNVLTFAYGATPDGTVHADIVLCLPVLLREAAAQQKTVLAHAAHLSIHGVLHALGYDHDEAQQAQHMEALETRILAALGVVDPYRADACHEVAPT